ncbi:MAG: hypothetical protein ACK2U9_00315 [Anaerolineae bacterium]
MQAGAKRLVKRLLFALLVLAVGLYLLLPSLVSVGAQEWLRDQGFTDVRLADVDFEPFGGELRLQGLQALHPSGQQLALQNGYTNVNWWALAKHRLHLQGIALEGLKLSLERGADGQLTLSGLTLPAGEPAEQHSGRPWGIGIDRLSITDSELQVRLPNLQRTFRLDDLLITGVRSWNSAQPAKLNLTLEADGTRVVVTGDALPFADEQTGSTHIRVESLDLARLGGDAGERLGQGLLARAPGEHLFGDLLPREPRLEASLEGGGRLGQPGVDLLVRPGEPRPVRVEGEGPAGRRPRPRR